MQVTPINCQPIKSFAGKKVCDCKECTCKQVYKEAPEQEYSNWGGNYAFPITVVKIAKPNDEVKEVAKEKPEEYYNRKLYSPEWVG